MRSRIKKLYPLFFLSLLIFARSNAQQADSKFFVQVSAGASLPVGKFGKKEMVYRNTPAKTNEGYANVGPSGSISIGFRFHKSLGAVLSITTTSNSLNKKPFADYFNTRVSNIILDADNWKILNVMAGGFYQIPINNKLNIKSQIQAGISSSKKPAYKVTLKDSQNDLTYFGNDLKTVFCYRLGTEFNYSLYRSIYLLADINYFSTSAAKASNSNDISAYRYSSLNMSAGVGFGF